MWQWLPMALKAVGINAGINAATGKPILQNAGQAAFLSQFGGADGGLLGGQEGAVIANNPATEIVENSIGSTGMKQIGDTFYNPDYFVGTSLGVPMYTGGEGLLSNVASDIGANLSSLTPQNLIGVASLLDQPDTSQYRQMAGTGGGVSRGSGQQLAVEMPQARVFKRRKA